MNAPIKKVQEINQARNKELPKETILRKMVTAFLDIVVNDYDHMDDAIEAIIGTLPTAEGQVKWRLELRQAIMTRIQYRS